MSLHNVEYRQREAAASEPMERVFELFYVVGNQTNKTLIPIKGKMLNIGSDNPSVPKVELSVGAGVTCAQLTLAKQEREDACFITVSIANYRLGKA